MSKLNKTIFFLLVGLINHISNGQELKVKFHNKTGHDIDSLTFHEVLIGELKKDSSTKFISLITFNSQEYPTGKINTLTLWNPNTYPKCGTGIKHYTSGIFEFDLELNDRGKGICLTLKYH